MHSAPVGTALTLVLGAVLAVGVGPRLAAVTSAATDE